MGGLLPCGIPRSDHTIVGQGRSTVQSGWRRTHRVLGAGAEIVVYHRWFVRAERRRAPRLRRTGRSHKPLRAWGSTPARPIRRRGTDRAKEPRFALTLDLRGVVAGLEEGPLLTET